MTDEVQEPGTPGYKSRKMLAAENDELKAGLADLMARLEKLESRPAGDTQAIVDAIRQDRDTQTSARLQRELDEARKQLDAFKRPETPTSGVPYSGWAQATETLWDGKMIRRGPSDPYNPTPGTGEVFQISLPDYWPGCPFVPVIVKGQDPGTGRYIVEPHPDYARH
jgi:hypothetical protein